VAAVIQIVINKRLSRLGIPDLETVPNWKNPIVLLNAVKNLSFKKREILRLHLRMTLLHSLLIEHPDLFIFPGLPPARERRVQLIQLIEFGALQ
jgi:hypothetical protein